MQVVERRRHLLGSAKQDGKRGIGAFDAQIDEARLAHPCRLDRALGQRGFGIARQRVERGLEFRHQRPGQRLFDRPLADRQEIGLADAERRQNARQRMEQPMSDTDTGRRCPRCDCPDGHQQCDHCKTCPHARPVSKEPS